MSQSLYQLTLMRREQCELLYFAYGSISYHITIICYPKQKIIDALAI